jgi:hypothetical protein
MSQEAIVSPRSTEVTQLYRGVAKKDELAFTLGVLNLCLSAWLVGFAPQCFWCYYCIKMPLLLSYKLYLNVKVKKQLFLLDWCYVVNYLAVIYFIACIVKTHTEGWNREGGINALGPYAFRCLFTICVGPLALAIIAFRNSLVLHDWNQVAVLATHWSPNIALWGMRWWPDALGKSFPGMFDIGCDNLPRQFGQFFSAGTCPGPFLELWVFPVCAYLVFWAIPYGLFMFYFGAGIIERGGYITMFDDMKTHPVLAWLLETCGGVCKPLKYMGTHAFACALVMLLGPLMWHSFAIHTTYLLIIFVSSVYNGGTFYFRVFAKRYYKEKLELASAAYEEKKSKQRQHQQQYQQHSGSSSGASISPEIMEEAGFEGKGTESNLTVKELPTA